MQPSRPSPPALPIFHLSPTFALFCCDAFHELDIIKTANSASNDRWSQQQPSEPTNDDQHLLSIVWGPSSAIHIRWPLPYSSLTPIRCPDRKSSADMWARVGKHNAPFFRTHLWSISRAYNFKIVIMRLFAAGRLITLHNKKLIYAKSTWRITRIRPVKPFISFGFPFDFVRAIDFTASISRIKMFTHRLPHLWLSAFFICCGFAAFLYQLRIFPVNFVRVRGLVVTWACFKGSLIYRWGEELLLSVNYIICLDCWNSLDCN